MQGPSHLLVSWYFADASGISSSRDRRIIWAAVVLGAIAILAPLGFRPGG
ncbi:MAG TPA: hypothetical protein VL180_07310 [Burkholderiales bacterium]|jgi:hypothetical protein|nr:hypothetical protein [Burkholderiales bacterium]